MKKVKYIRVSTVGQNTDRQKEDSEKYDLVIEDKISGAIPFFERSGGKDVRKLVDSNVQFELHVHSIDRLGQNLHDILNVVKFLSDNSINVVCYAQGLRTLDSNLKPNPIGKLILSILGSVAEMERDQSRERQLEGIRLAQMQNRYKGRKKGAKETTVHFLSKPKVQNALQYLKKGYKASEAAKLANVHPNTVTKIRRLAHYCYPHCLDQLSSKLRCFC